MAKCAPDAQNYPQASFQRKFWRKGTHQWRALSVRTHFRFSHCFSRKPGSPWYCQEFLLRSAPWKGRQHQVGASRNTSKGTPYSVDCPSSVSRFAPWRSSLQPCWIWWSAWHLDAQLSDVVICLPLYFSCYSPVVLRASVRSSSSCFSVQWLTGVSWKWEGRCLQALQEWVSRRRLLSGSHLHRLGAWRSICGTRACPAAWATPWATYEMQGRLQTS